MFSDRIYEAMTEKLISPSKKLPRRLLNGALRVLFSSLAASLGAMVFTTPLVAFYLNSVSLVAPISNLLTLGAISLLFLGGLLAAVLGLIWIPLGGILALPVSLIGDYLNTVILFLGRFSFAAVNMSSVYDRAWLVLLYILLLLWLFLGRKRPVIPLCCAVVTLCLCLVLTRISGMNASLTISVLDVGQGESVALLSGGETALLDCGGNGLTNAGDVAANYIQNLGTGETNEEGLSLLCTQGSYDALMTGDMGSDVESRLIKYDHLPDIELMVAGHHGSRYSSSDALLDAVSPETAVISVGYNTYGHPSGETLHRLEERGIAIYRTDQMGTVTIQVG